MISEFIFYDEAGSKEEKSLYLNLKVKVRDMLKDDFKRDTISKILLELRKDVSGAAQQRLFELFQDLELHQDSYKKLESWRWEHISSGIQELTRMEVHDAYSFLTKFINDKRTTIRKQAELALVTLNDEGINYFLDTTRNKISEWQQLKLIEIMTNKTDFVPPSFKAWLVSRNKYVVLFALRLIKFYDQNDANASIVELVKHRDDQIKQEAIDCIKAFHITDALPILKQVFWSCSIDIKIAILDAIANLGSRQDLSFLRSIGKKERNYSVTSKALSAINTIVPDSILPTEGIADMSSATIPDDIEVEEETLEADAIKVATLSEEAPTDEAENKQTSTPDVSEVTSLIQEEVVQSKLDTTDQEPVDLKTLDVAFSMDFLPFVTSHSEITNKKAMQTNINDIVVHYEEILESNQVSNTSKRPTNVNDIDVIIDMEFLPLVVPNEVKKPISLNEIKVAYSTVVAPAQPQTKENPESIPIEEREVIFEVLTPGTKADRLVHIPVNFEEVIPDQVEISFELDDEIGKHFDFEILFNNGQPPLRIPKAETLEPFEIDVNSKGDLADQTEHSTNVAPEKNELVNSQNEPELPDWLLNEIANEQANFNNREHLKMEGPEWEAKASQMMNEIQGYLKNLPTTEHLNKDISDRLQLLDDIELFGDEREIPLLQELMQKEDKIQTKERVDGLMKRFMGNDIYGPAIENLANYSVFEELFRNCDTESKLILLEEIVLIGDKKELKFLETLIDDPNHAIKKKAASAIKKLNERFERIANGEESKDADEYERFIHMMDLKPPKTAEEPAYFKIDFEVDFEDENKEENVVVEKKSIFNSLSDFLKNLIK